MLNQEFLPNQLEINFSIAAKIAVMAGRPRKLLSHYPTRLREVCELAGVTQTVLAETTGLSPSTISKLETGERQMKVTELEMLARALNQPASRLLNSTDPQQFEQERPLLEIFRRLPPEERERLVTIARALAGENGSKKVAS